MTQLHHQVNHRHDRHSSARRPSARLCRNASAFRKASRRPSCPSRPSSPSRPALARTLEASCPPSRTGRRRGPSPEPFPFRNAFQSRPSHVGGGAPREARRRACGARPSRVPRLSRHRIDGRDGRLSSRREPACGFPWQTSWRARRSRRRTWRGTRCCRSPSCHPRCPSRRP